MLRYKHQGINSRSLLLSCFRQHGGIEPDHPSEVDQDVLLFDVSRMSGADFLTIHDKLELIK